ncbi:MULTISPECIES: M56 family metallopeptidase [unclassified Clostridioides]|nr:M56 family metallopeptidase [Clostridioides sp. ZZV14-6154]MCC0670174.1 M56 family metallopeptidase [Clostridioides sp. ZZV14-6153]MCC0720402.1 M56 family metallopeptidase [Clostridioides sp. ZZV14-6105]
MNNCVNYLVYNILKTVIISSISICILIFLKTFFFKKFSKKFNYYIWLIIIFRMLFFMFNYSVNFFTDTPQKYFLINNISNLNNNIKEEISISFFILLIFAIGTIIYLYCVLSKYLKFKDLIIDTSFEIENESINNIYHNLLSELNIKQNITLRYTEEPESPAGMGLFKSYILLPDLPYSADEVYWILKHELTHFKNKDILIKFLVVFIKGLYWFNPFVFIMSKKISIDCELCCDESVLNNCSLKEKKSYGMTLLKSIELSNITCSGLLTTEFNKPDLEVRLENIINQKGKSGIISGILIFIITSTSFLEINALETIHKNIPSENKADSEYLGLKFAETIDYTYETAPEKYRKMYEETCKVLGEIPRKSDKIEVSTKSNTTIK